MRARFDGYSVARRHVPEHAEEDRARRRARSGRGPSGTATARWRSTARPSRSGWRRWRRARPGSSRTTKSLHHWRGLSGSGRSSPTLGHRRVDQRAAGDDDPDDDDDPGDGRAERALPPAPHVGVGADVGLGVAGPPVRRQPGAAPVLQVEDLGVGDAAELGDRAAAGRSGPACAAAARRTPAARPTPRRGGR